MSALLRAAILSVVALVTATLYGDWRSGLTFGAIMFVLAFVANLTPPWVRRRN